MLYAQAAQLVPPVDVIPGRAIEFDRMPVLNVTSFWLFALATSVFSAMNERELRQRRADLETLVELGAKLDDVTDPIQQSRIVLDGLAERFDFERGVVLGASDGRTVVLAARGVDNAPTTTEDADAVVALAWARKDLLPVRRLDPSRNPFLTSLLPGARNLLVSPLVADGRALGRRRHRVPAATGPGRRRATGRRGHQPALRDRGAEPPQRRPAAARPGPRRARLADRRGEPADVRGLAGARPRVARGSPAA